ncbi:Efflux pump periplasmic linker BepF [bioreactor metagenome]|uniref:Efflux pump periplasmic linker BepF n=1 Tax=bioreactor metagenome TaxID=1076179 RepID=A0A644WU82_9ZZZZ|nr:efflux RND transporter periplasmic adaptor subunit [Macellibacteroides fermentans]
MHRLFVCCVLTMALLSCKNNQTNQNQSIAEIPVIRIKPSNTVFNNNIVAEIQAVKNVEIRSRIKGYLEQIMVDEGKEVRKGQPLFKISSPEYTAEYTKAQATLKRAIAEEKAARLEVERVEMLAAKNVVVKSELVLVQSKADIAKAAVDEARATLKNAEAFLNFSTITAPFDGVVNRIPLKIGSLINEGDLLTSVSDISSIYAYFYLSEAEYLKYLKAKTKGDSVPDERNIHLKLADGSQYKHVGIVETVASEIEGTTGAIAFRARFINPEKMIKHGASGTITLETNMGDVIMIPQKSVMEIQNKNYVFVVDKSNKVKMRSVALGKRIGFNYIVQHGVAKEELIVYEGVQLLRDGNEIKPIEKNVKN